MIKNTTNNTKTPPAHTETLTTQDSNVSVQRHLPRQGSSGLNDPQQALLRRAPAPLTTMRRRPDTVMRRVENMGNAMVNNSAAAALGATARAVGNTVMPPTARAVGTFVLQSSARAVGLMPTPEQTGTPVTAESVRSQLQNALDRLSKGLSQSNSTPADVDQPAADLSQNTPRPVVVTQTADLPSLFAQMPNTPEDTQEEQTLDWNAPSPQMSKTTDELDGEEIIFESDDDDDGKMPAKSTALTTSDANNQNAGPLDVQANDGNVPMTVDKLQMDAHNALKAYAQSTGSSMDRVLPVLHKTAAVGGAGSGMAFGVGRSAGIAVANLALSQHRGGELELGFNAQAMPPGPPGIDALANAAAGWVLGSALGGVGNFVGQTLVAPLVNRINRQLAPVDPKAVVPDRMVKLMNQFDPGAGTALRSAVEAEQKQNISIASERNIAVGQFFFDAANAVKAGIQGKNSLGLAGSLTVGTVVSTLAGSCIGATIAINSSLATAPVPDLAALEALDAAHPNASNESRAALKSLDKHAVPLFFTKHSVEPGVTVFTNPVSDPAPSRAVVMGDDQGDLPEPPPARLATMVNTATSIAQRGTAMLRATTGTTMVAAVTPAFAASMPTERMADAARAVAAGVGIHLAIRPWFNALAADIPAGDKAIVAGRQVAVDAAATRQREQYLSCHDDDVELGLEMQDFPTRT